MKVIDLWECSACGAFYADKITACDCYMDGCTTLNHYHATLTSAGNSPVIPDGWTNVDEQMPEATRKDQYFITYRRPNKDFKSVTGGFSIDLFSKGCFAFSGVTHWMPLPAAPAQEQK